MDVTFPPYILFILQQGSKVEVTMLWTSMAVAWGGERGVVD